jgi:hypothetical protein
LVVTPAEFVSATLLTVTPLGKVKVLSVGVPS